MLIILTVFVIASAASGGGQTNKQTIVTVKRGDLIQEVSITGKVVAADKVEMSFEKNGRVVFIGARAGDNVKVGQMIMELNHADLSAQLAQARANLTVAQNQREQFQATLEREQAKLEELQQGTRQEEVNVAQAQFENTQTVLADARNNLQDVLTKADNDLENYYGDVLDTVNDAYIKADDVLKKQTSDLFTQNAIRTTNQLAFGVDDAVLEDRIESQKNNADRELILWKTSIDAATGSSTEESLDSLLDQSAVYLSHFREFLNTAMECADRAVNISETVISTYKTNINAGRMNISAAASAATALKQNISAQKQINRTNILAAETRVNDAQRAEHLARRQLELKLAGATPEQISAQEAQIRQAQAALNGQDAQIQGAQAQTDNFSAQIEKSIIRSPINGIVTKQEGEIGETLSANTIVVSVMSVQKYDLEANVAEVDIAKLKVGQKAKITLDAYGVDIEWDAIVIKINPGETIIEGVATYKTTLQFVAEDERFKPGLTANIDIQTDKREGALYVPQRAVISKNGDRIVRVPDGENFKEKKVEIGMKSSDGNVEILTGLSEEETVIIPSVL